MSPNIAHTGEVSTHNLRKVVQRLAEDPETAGEFAKAEEIRVWSDCGLHFRCEAVAKFVLVDIPTMSPRPPPGGLPLRVQSQNWLVERI